MNSKIHLRKNSYNKYFKAISRYFRVYSLWGFITATSFAALAEVQVAGIRPVVNRLNQDTTLYYGLYFARSLDLIWEK